MLSSRRPDRQVLNYPLDRINPTLFERPSRRAVSSRILKLEIERAFDDVSIHQNLRKRGIRTLLLECKILVNADRRACIPGFNQCARSAIKSNALKLGWLMGRL